MKATGIATKSTPDSVFLSCLARAHDAGLGQLSPFSPAHLGTSR